MPKRDLLRLQVAQQTLDRTMTVPQAATALGLSERQVKRLTRRLRLAGAEGFVVSRKGKPPNNAFGTKTRDRVLELARTTYRGFGPTFLAEKLIVSRLVVYERVALVA